MGLPSWRFDREKRKKEEEKLEGKLIRFISYNHRRFYGVVVSTLDFESSDLGSTPGRTFFWLSIFS
ncbi:hypothetical protein ES332_A04G133800v1 [Gossypium tomentosum]|uniref:Uncharacterized protein n=1 Tax=Gossypium tomentosum TaxID=34277 RepID=A0A5D2QXS3_GOSTO|nr:hypothetical protein ES332_A04G133800v1 [Gossypium tomentosum]